MVHQPPSRLACRALQILVLGLAAVPLLAVAQASPASLAGPSMVSVAAGATFSGRGLGPNTAVTIVVSAPDGSEAYYSAVVAPDGTLSYRVEAGAAGMYGIKVLDGTGKAVAATKFMATR